MTIYELVLKHTYVEWYVLNVPELYILLSTIEEQNSREWLNGNYFNSNDLFCSLSTWTLSCYTTGFIVMLT